MRKDQRFHSDMQRYVAVTTIGPSTLRNQGADGVVKAAQGFLGRLDLRSFRTPDEANFTNVLNAQTNELKQALPAGAQHWGAARKAMNLFLRDVCYNRFLSRKYRLAEAEPWMELPLDSLVGGELKRLARFAGHGRLPQWPGLTNLTQEVSDVFQAFAKECAGSLGISRVHLDMRLWTAARNSTMADR